MADNQSNVQTSVQQLDVDIDSLFSGAPGADSIITPTEPEAKPTVFSKPKTDLSFLDGTDDDNDTDEDSNKKTITKDQAKGILDEVLDKDIKADEYDDFDDQKSKAGRPRTEKSGLVEFLKKRIESKEMFAFDDYDEKKQSLEEYLSSLGEKDIEELWQANISNLKQEVAAQTPQEFFQSLPEELQYAAKYVADGGQDLKGLFAALAQVEQVREMNPADEYDQEMIVRQYLQATNFGNSDEIEEEITTWRDLGVLEKKS